MAQRPQQSRRTSLAKLVGKPNAIVFMLPGVGRRGIGKIVKLLSRGQILVRDADGISFEIPWENVFPMNTSKP